MAVASPWNRLSRAHRSANLRQALAPFAFFGALLGGMLLGAPNSLAQEQAASAAQMKLTLTLGTRAVAFQGPLEPVARRAVVFEAATADIGDDARQGILDLQKALPTKAAGDAGTLVVIAYHANPEVAFRRARAVRGELIERHQMDPARLIAAGREAQGHSGGPTVVDVYAIDPTTCAGCGESSVATLARDSGTMRLVTALLQTAPNQRQATGAAPAPLRAPPREKAMALSRDAKELVAPAPAAAKPADVKIGRPIAMPSHKTPSVSRVAPALPPVAGCPRPRIIIDDYYPGGPIVPCRRPSMAQRGS